eukprot:2584075-Karenia_brevis.AAC.1
MRAVAKQDLWVPSNNKTDPCRGPQNSRCIKHYNGARAQWRILRFSVKNNVMNDDDDDDDDE